MGLQVSQAEQQCFTRHKDQPLHSLPSAVCTETTRTDTTLLRCATFMHDRLENRLSTHSSARLDSLTCKLLSKVDFQHLTVTALSGVSTVHAALLNLLGNRSTTAAPGAAAAGGQLPQGADLQHYALSAVHDCLFDVRETLEQLLHKSTLLQEYDTAVRQALPEPAV